MLHFWLNLLIPTLSACLLAGGVSGTKAPRKEVIGFTGSNVDVVCINPDPSIWEPINLDDEHRPDRINLSLRHTGIRDSRGVDIQPVMSITAWKFPDDAISLDQYAEYLLKRSPMKESSRVLKEGRLFVQGTAFYGGYTHVISRALSYSNRVGIDLICDSTDSVYPKVKETFDSWLRSALQVPRITPTAVELPARKRAKVEDDAVVTTRVVEKQVPGGSQIGVIAGIKDEGGMVIFWNASEPYFKMRVEGNDFAGYGREQAMFTVDGVLLQVQIAELMDFNPDPSLKDPASILLAHRDWEYRYLQDNLDCKCVLQSWVGKLPDGSPVLYWDVTPENVPPGGAIKHVFCTRYESGAVIVVGSVETKDVSLDQAKNLVYYAITHVEFSKERFDIKKFKMQMAESKP